MGRFLRACAALGIPTGEHSPFDSAMWTRPLRCHLRQRWSFSHVDFCASGGRFRKTTWVLFIHCGTPSCRSLECRVAHNVCTFTDDHIFIGETRQNNQPLLAARISRRVAVFVADCLRQSVMNITVSRLSSLVSSTRAVGLILNGGTHTLTVVGFLLPRSRSCRAANSQALCLNTAVTATSVWYQNVAGHFFVCVLHAEGGWTGDLLSVEWEEFRKDRLFRRSREKFQV